MIVEAIYHCPTCRSYSVRFSKQNNVDKSMVEKDLVIMWELEQSWQFIVTVKRLQNTEMVGRKHQKKEKEHWQYSLFFFYKSYLLKLPVQNNT